MTRTLAALLALALVAACAAPAPAPERPDCAKPKETLPTDGGIGGTGKGEDPCGAG